MNGGRNTSNLPAELLLADMMIQGTSRSIEAMEAEGQRALVTSDVLPVEMRPGRKEFEALGFVFGEAVNDDPLFLHATLPEGWTRKPSDHSMWSYLVDELGQERVAIFYKAAFYDRHANMSLRPSPSPTEGMD